MVTKPLSQGQLGSGYHGHGGPDMTNGRWLLATRLKFFILVL